MRFRVGFRVRHRVRVKVMAHGARLTAKACVMGPPIMVSAVSGSPPLSPTITFRGKITSSFFIPKTGATRISYIKIVPACSSSLVEFVILIAILAIKHLSIV